MALTKHTPGPWNLVPADEDVKLGSAFCLDLSAIGWGSFARVVIRFNDESEPSKEGLANARLIAAAPDLLEALRYYASPEAWTVNQVEGADGDYGAKARAAIAKATGEA
jgi:hypothetical protein